MSFDPSTVRDDFPLLARRIDGKPIVYLDNAATSLRPRAVLDAMRHFDEHIGANVHRGKHALSEEATDLFEAARRKVAASVGVQPHEIVFTSGTTHGANVVALGAGFGDRPGGNVVTTAQEHHAMLLPFFDRTTVKLCPVGADGVLDVDALDALVDGDTRLVVVSHASNVTGVVHDVKAVVDRAHAKGVRVLVDGAQSVAHLDVDVADLGADWFVFSGHKMLGPGGIGVLTGRADRLEELGTPLRGGGAVAKVTSTSFSPRPLPARLEPGTPNIAGAIGLGAAVDYLVSLDRAAVRAHEADLHTALREGLSSLPSSARLLGRAASSSLPLVSLVIDSRAVSADHVAMTLSDAHQVMARSGHHCCHPYFDALGAAGALRLSAHLYTTRDEVDRAVAAVRDVLSRTLR